MVFFNHVEVTKYDLRRSTIRLKSKEGQPVSTGPSFHFLTFLVALEICVWHCDIFLLFNFTRCCSFGSFDVFSWKIFETQKVLSSNHNCSSKAVPKRLEVQSCDERMEPLIGNNVWNTSFLCYKNV